MGLTVEVEVRAVFLQKGPNALYAETLQVGYDAAKARKPTPYIRTMKI
jgi:hypothetical protein